MKPIILLLVVLSCNLVAAYGFDSNLEQSVKQAAEPFRPGDLSSDESSVHLANAQIDDLTIAQIMERAITAYGGKDELDKFRNDCFLQGKITFSPDKDVQFSYQHVRKDGCWRTDVATVQGEGTAKGSVRINGFDGVDFWQSNQQKSEILPADQANWLKAEESHKPFLLANWQEPGYEFHLLGPTLLEQVPVWAIEVSQQYEPAITIYLDRTNYLVIALAYHLSEPGDNKLVNVIWHYSEYRPVLGSLWPFEASETIDENPVLQLEISKCSTAGGVNRSFFNKPGVPHMARLSAPIVVPFDYTQGEIVLKGELEDGEQIYFLLDTGTSETLIDRRLAAQHLLAKGSNFKISGLSGDVSTQTTEIARLKIGQLIVNDVDAKIADLSQQSQRLEKNIAGIIGMNVVSNYLLTIDYGTPCLTFADCLSASPGPEMTEVPLIDSKDPLVKAMLADNDGEALLLDTGSTFNHLVFAVARRYLAKDNQNSQSKQATGLDGHQIRLGSVTIDPVKVGSQVSRKVIFTYPIEETAKSNAVFALEGTEAAGVLGNPFWQNFIVTLDMHSRRLFLKANPKAASKVDMEKNIVAGDSALSMHRDFRLAEISYQKALVAADSLGDTDYQAIIQGRLGNLRRIMAHDLHRAEHAHSAYSYFSKADELARKTNAAKIEGRILADWSILYSDNGQPIEAKQTINKALLFAPDDANVTVDLAVHLFRARQYADMQKYIEKALLLEPNNWQALWYEVKLTEMFGDANKEKETLTAIVKFYPWSQVAENKLKALTSPKSVSSPPASPKSWH